MLITTARSPRSWSWPAIALAALAAWVLIATIAAWTPSHYAQAARFLGQAHAGPLLGDARPVRSDEWGVTTPYYQIAVASGLGANDVISPYHEPLKAYFALPSRDWSMAFKPDLWGFLVLDPANAYALHYALLAASALLGAFLLLRQLGCSPGVAAPVAAMIFFSQFVQVWWSNNAQVLGLAWWPAAAFLWRGPWPLRLAAIFYACAVWLIGQLYPPLIIATALAMAGAVAAFRPEALRPGRLAPALIAAGAGIGVAWLHYGDLVQVMAASVYPGHRYSDGGGTPPLLLAAHLFPHLLTQRFEPIPLWPSNACEIAVAGSFLPLAMACFCDGPALVAWARERRLALTVWAAGLALMLAWMLAPIPAEAAPLLNLTPPRRLVWGFGLLLLIGLAVAADAQVWRLGRRRILVFSAIVLAAWAVSKLALAHRPIEFDRFDLIVVLALLLAIGLRKLAPGLLDARSAVLGACALAAAASFGTFNPVQSAKPIFRPPPSAAIEAFRAYARANPKGVVVAPGLYASILNGVGVPAVNHTLLQPQPAAFRALYGDMDPAARQVVFNRYAHLMPAMVWAPALVQEDVIAIPPDPFAIPLPVAAQAPGPGPARVTGAIEAATATPLGSGRWGVLVDGWADWRGVSPDQRLGVSLSPAAGRIVSASAFRLPRPDLAQGCGEPALFAAGFGLRLVIEGGAGAPEASQLILSAIDEGGVRSLGAPRRIAAAPPPHVIWPTPPMRRP